MVRSLLVTVMMITAVAPAAADIDRLVESGYSQVVLERLPAEDLRAISAGLETPVAECRPVAAPVAC